MAGRDDEERIRRAREQADRLRRRAARRASADNPAHGPADGPGSGAGDLPDGWSRVRLTAAQKRAVRHEQVLVGPGGVVLVGDAPTLSPAALSDLRVEPVTTCLPTEVGATLAALPSVLDPTHVEAARLRVEAALRSLDTGFTGAEQPARAAAPGSSDPRSRVPAVVAVVAAVVLLVLLVLAGPQLADQVGGLTG
jgi:hypothetical protein